MIIQNLFEKILLECRKKITPLLFKKNNQKPKTKTSNPKIKKEQKEKYKPKMGYLTTQYFENIRKKYKIKTCKKT